MNPLPPIGIFDSGVGGLTVWQAIRNALPSVPLVYFADQAHCPYGPQPLEQVRKYANNATAFLMDKGCRLVVVACNTATAAAIDHLRATFAIPFVGMEPAVKPACLQTRTKQVGILATKGTFEGRLFLETSAQFKQEATLYLQIGEGLVELVEAGKVGTPEAEGLLRKYLEPLLQVGIDQLVLGCTHYPFLKEDMQKITGSAVQILDPAPAVAKQTQRRYAEIAPDLNTAYQPEHTFFTSGDDAVFQVFLQKTNFKAAY